MTEQQGTSAMRSTACIQHMKTPYQYAHVHTICHTIILKNAKRLAKMEVDNVSTFPQQYVKANLHLLETAISDYVITVIA